MIVFLAVSTVTAGLTFTPTLQVSTAASSPALTTMTPNTATAAGGMTLVVTGSGFGTTVGDVTVRIGDREAVVRRVTATRIVATAPTSFTPGTYDVTVEIAGAEAAQPEVPLQITFTSSDTGRFGDFRVQNYATGLANGNWVWRGYVFKPARAVTVYGVWGGSGPNCFHVPSRFTAAIAEVEIQTSGFSQDRPGVRFVERLAEVKWDVFLATTPEYQDFPEPITLSPDNL